MHPGRDERFVALDVSIETHVGAGDPNGIEAELVVPRRAPSRRGAARSHHDRKMRRPAASSDLASWSILNHAGMATVSGGALGESSPFEATRTRFLAAVWSSFNRLAAPATGRTSTRSCSRRSRRPRALSAVAARSRSSLPTLTVRPATTAFDLGAGVGAVGLALLRFGAAKRVVFVEIDEQPAAMARSNLDANGWADRGEVVRGDVSDVARSRRGEAAPRRLQPALHHARAAGTFRSPKRGPAAASSGPSSTRPGRWRANEPACASSTGPRSSGRCLRACRDEGLHAKRMRFVHGTRGAPARVVLVEAQAGRPGGLFVMPPLVEREEDGYTREMESLLARE